MMFSPGSLRPAARSMEDHFDCFENVSQLSMALETLYLVGSSSIRRNCFSGQARLASLARHLKSGCSGRFGDPWSVEFLSVIRLHCRRLMSPRGVIVSEADRQLTDVRGCASETALGGPVLRVPGMYSSFARVAAVSAQN